MKEQLSRAAPFFRRNPWQRLLLSALVCLAFAPGLLHLETDFTTRSWFAPDDPLLAELNGFEKLFGNDESIVVVVRRDAGIFDGPTIALIRQITSLMQDQPGIESVESLTNHLDVSSQGDDIFVRPFYQKPDALDGPTLAQKRRRAEQHAVIPGYLADRGNTLALIHGQLPGTLGHEVDYHAITSAVQEILDQVTLPAGVSLHLSGAAALNDAFQVAAARDMALTTPVLLLAIILLLFLLYRRLPYVLLPVLLILMTQISVMGFCGYAGFSVDSVIAVLPMVMIAIAMADAVHMQTACVRGLARHLSRKEAMAAAVKRLLLPTVLTSLTTAGGFLSLTMTSIRPIWHFGLAAACGCILAWFFTWFTLLPALQLWPEKGLRPHPRAWRPGGEWLPRRLAGFLSRHQRIIRPAGLLLAGGALVLATGLRIDSEPNAYFTERVPVRQANDLIYDRIGGFNGPEIVLDSGRRDGVQDPAFLQQVARLEAWLDERPEVNQTVSVADIIRALNQVFHSDDPTEARVPDDENLIAQELLFYSMGAGGGPGLESRISRDGRYTRLTVLWGLTTATASIAAMDEIHNKMRELGLQGYATGKYFLLYRLNQYVVETLTRSVFISFVLVSVVLFLVFGSLRTSAGALLANLIPIFVGGAAIVLMGKTINLGTAMVVSICLGIAVDDTIHLISAWHDSRGRASDRLRSILRSTGQALIITTLILIMGFGSFLLGDFVPNIELGLFCCIVLGVALITDLVWLPCMLQAGSPLSRPQAEGTTSASPQEVTS